MKEPDSKTDSALRWGQYVVQHFQPGPGSLVFMTHSGTDGGPENTQQMADALQSALATTDHSGEVVVVTAPNSYSVRELPTEEMNRCGWYHESQLTEDERARLKSDMQDHG